MICGKQQKIGKGNIYLTENRLSKNVMGSAADNYNRPMCKRIFRFEQMEVHVYFIIMLKGRHSAVVIPFSNCGEDIYEPFVKTKKVTTPL